MINSYLPKKTRRIAPEHTTWEPRPYQKRAVAFVKHKRAAALFIDPGLGKTSIVLEAFNKLYNEGRATQMLVVAPLRVCQLVWRQEIAKWTQFRHLRVSFLHGPRKEERLTDDADIWLINPEGIPWLTDRFWKRRLPFDTLVIDELTKFKNHRAQRSKKLFPHAQYMERRWGLTGTPMPNGYLDLFGQMLILDGGAALGRYITHYRDRYFEKGWDGFSWTLRLGADKQIEERIKPYVLRMSADDYLQLPPLIPDLREIELPPAAQKKYEQMKREMLLEFPEGVVTAANAAAAYSKLKQMANGRVYMYDEKYQRSTVNVHTAKLDALEELIEELSGQQLLVAYEFQHDLDAILDKFGDIPYLGKNVTEKRAMEIEREWNAGNIPVLATHPASAGHGINFQLSSARHICWYSLTVDYELYDQLIRRIWRSGNKATSIVNHFLIVKNTVDEKGLGTIGNKKRRQDAFLDAVNAELQPDDEADTAAARIAAFANEEKDMVRKLRRRNEEEVEDEEELSAEATDEEDEEEQRTNVRRKLRGGRDREEPEEDEDEDDAPASSRARKMFSKGVRSKLDHDEGEEADEEEAPAPAKRSLSRKGVQKSSLKRAPATREADPDDDDAATEIDYDRLADMTARRLLGHLGDLLKRLADE